MMCFLPQEVFPKAWIQEKREWEEWAGAETKMQEGKREVRK